MLQESENTETENMQITLTNVRGSFLEIFRAKSVNDGEPRFSGNFLIAKDDTKNIKKVRDAIDSLIKEKNKGKALPADKIFLRDGDEKEYDGFEGHWFVSAANKKRPQVVDRDKSPLAEEDGKPESGDIVNVVIRAWWQDNKFGKRVNASLEVVQFVKEGERFGPPKVDLDEALPELEDEDDDM